MQKIDSEITAASSSVDSGVSADPNVQKMYSDCLKRIFKWNMFRKFGPGEKANIDQMRNMAKYFGNP